MKSRCAMWNAKGIWLKGNTHTHSDNSDGAYPPGKIAAEYKCRGYDFVFLTDHDKRTVPAETIRKPLLIPAEEIAFSYKGYIYHFVCLGLKKEWAAGSVRTPGQMLARARREGVLMVLAHPYWCGVPSYRCVYPGGLTCPGIEVYNNVCDWLNGKGYSNVHWDDLLDAGHHVLGFAADDMHNVNHIGGGWIMVKAKSRAPDAILAAIRKGDFYSSQGPEIKAIVMRGREISVACSPVRRINFVTNRYEGKSFSAKVKSLTKAVWTAPRGKRYVRIELIGASGKMAWSNPIFF